MQTKVLCLQPARPGILGPPMSPHAEHQCWMTQDVRHGCNIFSVTSRQHAAEQSSKPTTHDWCMSSEVARATRNTSAGRSFLPPAPKICSAA